MIIKPNFPKKVPTTMCTSHKVKAILLKATLVSSIALMGCNQPEQKVSKTDTNNEVVTAALATGSAPAKNIEE